VATTVNGVTTYTLSATQQSTGTGVGTAGIMVGCMLAGQIAHLGGRRLCFYAVAIISIIGVLIEATAGINGGRYYQMVVGKIFVGSTFSTKSPL
jgi:MFS family permease